MARLMCGASLSTASRTGGTTGSAAEAGEAGEAVAAGAEAVRSAVSRAVSVLMEVNLLAEWIADKIQFHA
jgi:hypothetical protein